MLLLLLHDINHLSAPTDRPIAAIGRSAHCRGNLMLATAATSR